MEKLKNKIALTSALPEKLLQKLNETPQNPTYHAEGSVLRHTEMVLEQLEQLSRKIKLSESDYKVLYWTACLHDIGKISTTVWQGRWRAPGHEKASVPIANNILHQHPEISPEERRKILSLIRWHGFPRQWISQQGSLSAVKRLATQVDLRLLSIFTLCDMHGRISSKAEEFLPQVKHFHDFIVPRAIYELAQHHTLQVTYNNWPINVKNAAWSAYQHKNLRLLNELLHIETTPSAATTTPQIIWLFGPAAEQRKGEDAMQLPNALEVSLSSFFSSTHLHSGQFEMEQRITEFRYHLRRQLRNNRQIVLRSDALPVILRRKLSEAIRSLNIELQYWILDDSWDNVVNKIPEKGAERLKEVAWEQYQNTYELHPWEAHTIKWITPTQD